MGLKFLTTNGRYDKSKSTVANDNSSYPNRLNGAPKGADQPKGKAALYAGTRGSNGLPGQIVAERAYYAIDESNRDETFSNVSKAVERLQSGGGLEGDLELVKAHFDPRLILPPTHVCIKYHLNDSIPCINLSDTRTQRMLEPYLKPALIELLQAYKEELKSYPETEKLLPTFLVDEIRNKREGEALSVPAGILGEVYAISQPLGNIILAENITMSYHSARLGSVLNEEFTRNSQNLAIPTTGGQKINMEPLELYSFNPESKRIVSTKAEDGAKIGVPEEGSGKEKK
jgi:hypothetical protein